MIKALGIWSLAAAVAVVSTVAAPAAHGFSAAAATCPRDTESNNWNPYDLSAAELAACDMTAYPMTSIEPLPGGGSDWIYETPSGPMGMLVPPANFDPATATADQLAEYGIPTEPAASDAVLHDAWSQMIAGMTHPAQPFNVMIGLNAKQFNRNPLNYVQDGPWALSPRGGWVGYTDDETSGYFHYAWSAWIEPSPLNGRCGLDAGAAAFWTGLGGTGGSSDLGQAGTELGFGSGGPDDAFWYETNSGTTMYPHGAHATQGSEFSVDVSYNTSTDEYNYYFYNAATGSYGTYHGPTSSYVGDTTDFMAERLYEQDFTNFGEMEWEFAESAVQEYPLDHYPYTNWQLTSDGYSDGRKLATANDTGTGSTPTGVSGDGPFYIGMNSCN